MARATTVVAAGGGSLVSYRSRVRFLTDAIKISRWKRLCLIFPPYFAGAMLFVCYSCVVLASANQVPGADGEGRLRPRWYGLSRQ